MNNGKGKANAAPPGYVATDIGYPAGRMHVTDGAKTSVRFVLLPNDGPRGGYLCGDPIRSGKPDRQNVRNIAGRVSSFPLFCKMRIHAPKIPPKKDNLMPTLFDFLTVGPYNLRNRMIMAPMTRSRADDAGVQPDIAVTYYTQRAGAGLIITEAINVSPMAKGYPRTSGLFTPEQIAAWKKVTDSVHAQSGLIFAQLFHTGRVALPDFLPNHAQPVGPSAIAIEGQNYTDEGMKPFVTPRALETSEIPGIVDEFAQATRNALLAGFDGVELHGASGYIVHQFLSPAANQRTDEYGGSVENRVRFLLEVLDGMIAVADSDRVGVKFSPQMPFNGNDEPDADDVYSYIMRSLSPRNLAYVHVADHIGADWHTKLRPLAQSPFFAGANFDKEKGINALTKNSADAIVYGVLFLANPDLVIRFEQNAGLNPPDNSTFYVPGPHGYIDYPTLAEQEAK